MAKKLTMIDLRADTKLLEWLTSNPMGEVYRADNPVIGVSYETTRTTKRGKSVAGESGFRRWPIVPDAR